MGEKLGEFVEKDGSLYFVANGKTGMNINGVKFHSHFPKKTAFQVTLEWILAGVGLAIPIGLLVLFPLAFIYLFITIAVAVGFRKLLK